MLFYNLNFIRLIGNTLDGLNLAFNRNGLFITMRITSKGIIS